MYVKLYRLNYNTKHSNYTVLHYRNPVSIIVLCIPETPTLLICAAYKYSRAVTERNQAPVSQTFVLFTKPIKLKMVGF